MISEADATIISKDATAGSIRLRQILAVRQWAGRPLADYMIKHSLNELDDWRRSVSGDRTHLFLGRPVMAETS